MTHYSWNEIEQKLESLKIQLGIGIGMNTFETGAKREDKTGKGRCDLLPLDAVGQLYLSKPGVHSIITLIFTSLNAFMVDKNIDDLVRAVQLFCSLNSISISAMLLETSIHYEEGAVAHGANNWRKGLPLTVYLSSGIRHLLKYLDGLTDERHDRAFVWNMLGAIWTMQNKPEMDDISL